VSAPAVSTPAVETSGMTDIPIALKAKLVDEQGVAYRDFRRGLTPRYGRVWRDIGLGYAAIFAIPVAILAWDPGFPVSLVAAVVGALLIGYVMAFVNNFFHEAAHYNLHPDRDTNDRLTNAVMGWMFGSDIATYRKIHFQHHRALGTTADSENSYFDPLGTRYLVDGLLGLKVVRTLRRYREMERDKQVKTKDGAGASRLLWMAICAGVNLAIAGVFAALGSLPAAAAWLGGLLLFFPFFVSLRQVLEHRSEEADPDVDYRDVDHGAVNRLFGDGPLASTLGSAGFNRHALHHWEPNVSYTRLKDIEQYLLRTEIAPLVRSRRTTYPETFLRLFEL
jgi:fatty acid desaturase